VYEGESHNQKQNNNKTRSITGFSGRVKLLMSVKPIPVIDMNGHW
jgi:hypothetical protein